MRIGFGGSIIKKRMVLKDGTPDRNGRSDEADRSQRSRTRAQLPADDGENAGQAVWRELALRCPQPGRLLVVCGKGNNGGDGFVTARAAAQAGWQVWVLLAEGEPCTPDAQANWQLLAGMPWVQLCTLDPLPEHPFTAAVDALYGTGFHGTLRPQGAAACALLERCRRDGALVFAADLPSGCNADTGAAAPGAVRADVTVTFDSCKPVHFSAPDHCGQVICADIGILDAWHPSAR